MSGRKKVEDLLILVDDNDNEIGYGEKMETHITGRLHRAFSLFVFDKKSRSLLIHQRAAGKYHSGGLWTNSCCSHPRKGETLQDAVVRRAYEELGLRIPCGDGTIPGLIEVGKFKYFADFGDISEHEIDHVFIWETDGQVNLNPDSEEVMDFMWIEPPRLTEWMQREPGSFTAWFAPALSIVKKSIIGKEYFAE
jgi:isopentenyl-diphosphate delta-isomerase type 1